MRLTGKAEPKKPMTPEREAEIKLFLAKWLSKNIGTKPPTIN